LPDVVVLVFLIINQQTEMKIYETNNHTERKLGDLTVKNAAIYQQIWALHAAGLTRYYANKIRGPVACPNVVPIKLQYGNYDSIGAICDSMRYLHIIVNLG
jgi:hypothetical protein